MKRLTKTTGPRLFLFYILYIKLHLWLKVQIGFILLYIVYCSFDTDQSQVSLYMTAIASVSKLVQKPTVTVKLYIPSHKLSFVSSDRIPFKMWFLYL